MAMKDLKQERNMLATQMRDMHRAAEKEDRGFTSDEQKKWDEMSDQIDKLDQRIKNEERAKDLSGISYEEIEDMKPAAAKQAEKEQKGVSHSEAFGALLRSRQPGDLGLSKEQSQALVRAQSVGTDSAGGYMVPTELQGTIIDRMVQFGGLRGAANVISTDSGHELTFPTNDDSGNTGALIAENTQDSEQDLVLGQVVLDAYKYTSRIIRVPIELLQDSAFDLESYLSMKFGERLGRATSAHYCTGTGSGQPNGISVAATSGLTAASATAVTYNEMLDLKHSVDPAYRGNGSFLMNDSSLLALKKLQDADNRPLWMPDVAGVTPATLDGSPYVIDQAMPSIASTTKPIVFGDLNGYWIRDVMGITLTRMIERYADFHQVGFVAIMRTDGELVDANSCRAITMAV